jgi:hypothetical protein
LRAPATVENSEWFVHDLEEQLKENHRIFLEELITYEQLTVPF